MRTIISTAFLGCVTARVSSDGEPDLDGYTFDDYKKDYPKAYNSDSVEARRKEVFDANMKLIRQQNSMDGTSWWADVNQFTDMTNSEFRALISGTKPAHLFHGGQLELDAIATDLPDRVDWRESSGVVTPVKDQGGCGSCWAFSAAQTFESHLSIATGEAAVKLSPQQIVSCSPNPQHCGGTGGCDGSTQPLAFNYTQTAGLSSEADYPYAGTTGTCQSSKIKPVGYNNGGYVQLPVNDYSALMSAVATKGPIAISIAAGGFAFQFYGGGVLSNCNDYVMDHAVQLVGYGSTTDASTNSNVDYWLVRNSWGNWGENGYIRMKRYGEGKEPCGTDSKPQDGDACDGDTAPRTYCGECGILSSSSYPTGMSKTQGPSVAV